jgi:hypothetical protein
LTEKVILVALEDYGINTQYQWNVVVKKVYQCEELNVFALVEDRQNHISHQCPPSIYYFQQ